MFNKIDFQNWERVEQYNHFIKNAPCAYNITANLDITILYNAIKAKKLKLYPTFIYMLSKVVNENYEFRMAINENDVLGYYDICHPSYTITNAIEGSFSGIWSNYNQEFSVFYNEYIKDVENYSNCKTYSPKANQPKNTFYVSCTPEIEFTSLNLHLYNGSNFFAPIFTIGKFFYDKEKIKVPLAVYLNHAVCDGFHSAKLFKELQKMANNPYAFLK